MAAALVCSKIGIRVGHLEAGFGSRDRGMPEEMNRLLRTSCRICSSLPPRMATRTCMRRASIRARFTWLESDHRYAGASVTSSGTSISLRTSPARMPSGLCTVPSNVDDCPGCRACFLHSRNSASNSASCFQCTRELANAWARWVPPSRGTDTESSIPSRISAFGVAGPCCPGDYLPVAFRKDKLLTRSVPHGS